MENKELFAALWTIVSLAGIAYLLLWSYREYRIDLFRQRMFALRDDLFDEAADGLISFDHPAYGTLRSTMNGFIRFGHRLSLWQGIVLFLLQKVNNSKSRKTGSFAQTFSKAVKTLSGEKKDRLLHYRNAMEFLVMRHLFLSVPEFFVVSIPLILVFLLVALWSLLKSFFTKRKRKPDQWKRIRDSVDDAALIQGQIV